MSKFNFSIRQRLAMAVSVFLIPLGVFGYLFLYQVSKDIEFARKETQGLDYQRKTWALFLGVSQASVDIKPVYGLSAVVDDMARLGSSYDDAMSSAKLGKDAIASAKVLKLDDPLKSSEDALINAGKAAIALHSQIGDGSNLILDPDLDSYYLTDIVIQRAPDMVVALRELVSVSSSTLELPGTVAADRVRLIVALQRLRSSIDQWETSFTKSVLGNPDKSLEPVFSPLLKQYQGYTSKLLAAADKIETDTAFNSDIRPELRSLLKLAREMLTGFDQYWRVPAKELDRLLSVRMIQLRAKSIMAMGLALVTAALAFMLAVFFSWRITKSLHALRQSIHQAADGKHDQETPFVNIRTEIGSIARAVDRLKASTVSRVNDVNMIERESALQEKHHQTMRLAAEEIRTAVSGLIADLRMASSEMAATTAIVYEASTDTQIQMGGTAATLQETADNVNAVASSSEEFARSISEITDQTNISSRIADEVKLGGGMVQECVTKLHESAARIGDIVSTISKISSQTNLLALNATIEAARAGEAGRGFSIVAAEVKQLASQTEAATQDVGTQVKCIRDAIAEVAATVKTINGVVERNNDVAMSIASAIQEQSVMSDNIEEHVKRVAKQTNHASQAVDQVASLARSTGSKVKALQVMSDDLLQKADRLESSVESVLNGMIAA